MGTAKLRGTPEGVMIVDGEKLRRLCKNWYWKDGHVSLTWGELLGAVKSCEVKIQPPAKIEVAIRAFEERAEDFLTANGCDLKGDFADLLRWVLGQEQDTWKPGDFGLEKETPNQKGR